MGVVGVVGVVGVISRSDVRLLLLFSSSSLLVSAELR